MHPAAQSHILVPPLSAESRQDSPWSLGPCPSASETALFWVSVGCPSSLLSAHLPLSPVPSLPGYLTILNVLQHLLHVESLELRLQLQQLFLQEAQQVGQIVTCLGSQLFPTGVTGLLQEGVGPRAAYTWGLGTYSQGPGL